MGDSVGMGVGNPGSYVGLGDGSADGGAVVRGRAMVVGFGEGRGVGFPGSYVGDLVGTGVGNPGRYVGAVVGLVGWGVGSYG